MNRGSAFRRAKAAARWACFNEAPIHESGKYQHGNQAVDQARGFNEAPIHESGKSLPIPPGVRAIIRFNEAPIHESGK